MLIIKDSDSGILYLGLLGFRILSAILLEKEHYISEMGCMSLLR
jgi:hypothetical protein